MLDRLFPKQIDNDYRGYWLALGLFVLLLLVRVMQGLESVFNTHDTMINADGIPLDNYDAAAALTMIRMFALLGLNLLVIPMLSLVALARYRAMIPLLFLMSLLVQISGRALVFLHPVVRSGGPPIGSIVNLVIIMATIIGFVLSLQDRAKWRA